MTLTGIDASNQITLLKPGMMLHVEAVTPAGIRTKFKVPLIGYQEGEFILLQYPDPNRWGDCFEILQERYEVIIRFLLEDEDGTVIGFKSQVLGAANKPVKMLIISYPRQVQKHGLRAEPRHKILLPASVKMGGKMLRAQVMDLSHNGCRVKLAYSPEDDLKGEEMTILVEDAQKDELFHLLGVVCNQREELGNWSVGIRLKDEGLDSAKKLLNNMLVSLENLHHEQEKS